MVGVVFPPPPPQALSNMAAITIAVSSLILRGLQSKSAYPRSLRRGHTLCNQRQCEPRLTSHSDVDIRDAFGAALRQARERVGISQEKLAYACGLDRTTLSLLERGRQQPTLQTILILAEHLEMTGADLVGAAEELLDSSP